MEKIKKYLSVIISAAVYLITFAALYVVEYRLYDKAFKALSFYLMVVWPAIFVSSLLRSREPAKKEAGMIRRRIRFAINCLLLFSIMIVLYFLYFRNESYKTDLVVWQILAMMAAAGTIGSLQILRHWNNSVKFAANTFSVVISSLLLATVLFLLITGPQSVGGAAGSMRDIGYKNPEYIMRFHDTNVLAFFKNGHLPESYDYADNSSLGLYLFYGEIDDAEYGVFIDVRNGEIVEKLILEDNHSLRNTIERIRNRSGYLGASTD